MDRWNGKIAVVTGAGSGIGLAICKDLVKFGLICIGLDRQIERIEALQIDLQQDELSGRFHPYYCDICVEDSVKEAFEWIERQFGGVNILINNAGVSKCSMILSDEDNQRDLNDVINTNILGLLMCTRRVYRILRKNDAEGHIVNVNSVMGHYVPNAKSLNIYPDSKHAVTATTEVIRQELNYLQNRKVKVTSVSPGLVKTNIFINGGYQNIDRLYKNMVHLRPEDIAQAILYVLGTSANVQIHELMIKPVGEQM